MYQGTLETISNRADWFGTIELINDDTGEVITDLSGATIKLAVRDRGCYSPRLSAETGDYEITVIDGVIQWHFTASQMSALCQGVYEIGLTVTRDDITDQELIAILTIVDGIVR
jgi:hypothetical protein